MLIALLAGAGIAFFGALPVAGPVAVLILDRALAGHRREAMALALGAAIPEGIYAGAAALGAAALLERVPALLPVAHLLAGGVVVVVGALLLRQQAGARASSPVAAPSRGAVLTALLLTALNPTLLATWAAVGAPLVAAGVIQGAGGAAAFGLGAAAGAWGGGATLATVVASHGWRLGEGGVRITRRGAGVVLVGLGVVLLVRAVLAFGGG